MSDFFDRLIYAYALFTTLSWICTLMFAITTMPLNDCYREKLLHITRFEVTELLEHKCN